MPPHSGSTSACPLLKKRAFLSEGRKCTTADPTANSSVPSGSQRSAVPSPASNVVTNSPVPHQIAVGA